MKARFLKLLLPLVLCVYSSHAQLVTSAEGMHLLAGTVVGVDSLMLIPATDYYLQSTGITTTNTASSTYVGSSILRTYIIQPEISFSGTLGLIYADDALGANPENNLVIAYADSFSTSCVLLTNSTADVAGNTVQVQLFASLQLHRITSVANPAQPAGVAQALAEDGFKVWPNPASEVLNLQNASGQCAAYRLYDALGREVGSGTSSGSAALDLRGLAAGTYLLKVEAGGKSTTFNVLKQ